MNIAYKILTVNMSITITLFGLSEPSKKIIFKDLVLEIFGVKVREKSKKF